MAHLEREHHQKGVAMTRRERLRRCYFNQDLDRPAVYSRTGYPRDDPTYDRLRSYLGEHSELKAGWSAAALRSQPPTETQIETRSEDWDRHTTVLPTPKGDLSRTYLSSRKGLPGLHETYFIDCRHDAEAYLALPMAPLQGDPTAFFEADAAIGDAGITEASLGTNPAGFVADLCGSETFAILSVTDRDILHEMCRRRMEDLIARVRYLLERGVGPYFAMLGEEYLVPPLHGRDDFYDFNVRYDKPFIDLIHEGGGRIHIHSHGSLTAVFQGFVDMGADVLHPFEPPPLGDITAAEAKNRARGHLCLEGNLQIHHMYEHGPAEVRAEGEALIGDVFDDGRGLIVSPSASPYVRGEGEVCFPQYEAMVETVLAAEEL